MENQFDELIWRIIVKGYLKVVGVTPHYRPLLVHSQLRGTSIMEILTDCDG